jgi:uncharacterized protein YfaS (alpha-2-macroglobulin family)
MIERGTQYLAELAGRAEPIQEYPWQRGENTSLRAYILYAVAQSDAALLQKPEIVDQLRKIFDARDKLSDYARALSAVTLADANLKEESTIMVGNIVDRARRQKDNGTAFWGQERGYYYWHEAGTEATSYSLRALIRLEPTSPLIPEAVNWLVRNRQGTRWFNTKDTALATLALADYLRLTGELDPDLTIVVDVDGQETRRVRVTKENLFTFDDTIVLAGDAVGTGDKGITVRAEGRGNVYWGAYASFFTKEEKILAGGNELLVTRSYTKLSPKEVVKTRTVYDTGKPREEKYMAVDYDKSPLADGDELASGDLIEVTLAIDAKNNFEYLIFEDPKPAGCEAVELQSGYQWGGGFGAHTEMRDEKIAFFASYLNQGQHTIAYRLRAEIPGQFHALPARGECMYTPFVQGNADSARFRIVDAR